MFIKLIGLLILIALAAIPFHDMARNSVVEVFRRMVARFGVGLAAAVVTVVGGIVLHAAFATIPYFLGGTWVAVALLAILLPVGTIGMYLCMRRSDSHAANPERAALWRTIGISLLALLLLYLLPWQGLRVLQAVAGEKLWSPGTFAFWYVCEVGLVLFAIGKVLKGTANMNKVTIDPSYGSALLAGMVAVMLNAVIGYIYEPVNVYDPYDATKVMWQLEVPAEAKADYDVGDPIPKGARLVPISWDRGDAEFGTKLFPLSVIESSGWFGFGATSVDPHQEAYVIRHIAEMERYEELGQLRKWLQDNTPFSKRDVIPPDCEEIREWDLDQNDEPDWPFGHVNTDGVFDEWDCKAAYRKKGQTWQSGGVTPMGTSSGTSGPSGSVAGGGTMSGGAARTASPISSSPKWAWLLVALPLLGGFLGYKYGDASNKAGGAFAGVLFGLIIAVLWVYAPAVWRDGAFGTAGLTSIEEGPRFVEVTPSSRGIFVGVANLAVAETTDPVVACRCDKDAPVVLSFQVGSASFQKVGKETRGTWYSTQIMGGQCVPLERRGARLGQWGDRGISLSTAQHTTWWLGHKSDNPGAHCPG